MKKGLIVYNCYLDISAYDKCNMDIEEWHVISIDKEFVYLYQKIERVTWVKRSSKTGDYGWDKNIHKVWKDKIEIEKFYEKYSKTKSAAFNKQKPLITKMIKTLNSYLRKIEKNTKK